LRGHNCVTFFTDPSHLTHWLGSFIPHVLKQGDP
jgi:hypothetical protein